MGIFASPIFESPVFGGKAGGRIYATLDPNGGSTTGTVTYSNGDLSVHLDRTVDSCWAKGTLSLSGKQYFETTVTAQNVGGVIYHYAGVMDVNTARSLNIPSVHRALRLWSGNKDTNGTESAYGVTLSVNDVLGIAVDMTAGKIWFSKNGTWMNSGDPAAGTNAAFTDLVSSGVTWRPYSNIVGQTTTDSTWNFGKTAFAHAAPAGFDGLYT